MSLVLRHSRDLPNPDSYRYWLATTGTEARLDPRAKLPGLALRLEDSFMESRRLWWRLGRQLAGDPGAEIAKAPTGGFGSDFGVMLAWSRLAEDLAEAEETCLAVCDDPWLFRHLAGLPGVRAGRPPALWPRRLMLWLRGHAARCSVALSVATAVFRLRRLRSVHPPGDAVLLVYGHPRSDALGNDAYFGDLMKTMPGLKRLLHTDCAPGRAWELAADGRTASLHGWGNPFRALGLVAVRWRPRACHTQGPHGWLVRRAAELENGGGGPAMSRWQIHCQQRWLDATRPSRVAWPWENHPWEREFCRAARRAGVATVGYQHTTIGPHQINFSPASNPDGLESIPDTVSCDGPAYRDELAAWGIPEDRMVIGGAFRFERLEDDLYDPEGPVFVPLSANMTAARHQLAAARDAARSGRRVLVKEHPLYPVDFTETENMKRTETPMTGHRGLSAVVFTTGTTGLDGLFAGLPTFRLALEDRIAINVVPEGVEIPTVSLEELPGALAGAVKPPRLKWDSILAPVDLDVWRRLLGE